MITDHRFVANFVKYRYLLKLLVERDIKIKYKRSVLGVFWSFLEPLISMIVLTIIFSTFFARDIPNYPVYFLTGRLLYSLFSGGTSLSMRSIIGSGGIIKTVYVPKYIYPLASVFSEFFTFLLSLIVLFGVMLATNVQFTFYIIFSSLPILVLLLMTIGVGLIVGTLTVFFRDIEHLYGILMLMLFYATPIIYPPEVLPESFRWIQTYNPLYAVIVCVRDNFLYGKFYDPYLLLYAAVFAIISLILGIVLFYKFQDKFVLHI